MPHGLTPTMEAVPTPVRLSLKDDPVRASVLFTRQSERQSTNGTKLLLDMYLITATKPA